VVRCANTEETKRLSGGLDGVLNANPAAQTTANTRKTFAGPMAAAAGEKMSVTTKLQVQFSIVATDAALDRTCDGKISPMMSHGLPKDKGLCRPHVSDATRPQLRAWAVSCDKRRRGCLQGAKACGEGADVAHE
jgi:hypothetical protein